MRQPISRGHSAKITMSYRQKGLARPPLQPRTPQQLDHTILKLKSPTIKTRSWGPSAEAASLPPVWAVAHLGELVLTSVDSAGCWHPGTGGVRAFVTGL